MAIKPNEGTAYPYEKPLLYIDYRHSAEIIFHQTQFSANKKENQPIHAKQQNNKDETQLLND